MRNTRKAGSKNGKRVARPPRGKVDPRKRKRRYLKERRDARP